MQTKAPIPTGLLPAGHIHPLIEVYYEANQLKQLYRQGWLHRGVPPERCESVAEHTFSMALLALFVTDAYFPQLDREKIIRMTLLHEMGEIYAGDLTPSDGVDLLEKHALEKLAVLRVLSKLPRGAEYAAVWEEFEAGETPEARLVRQLDRLEMSLQASVYAAQGLVDPSEFYQTTAQALQEPVLQQLFSNLLNLGKPPEQV